MEECEIEPTNTTTPNSSPFPVGVSGGCCTSSDSVDGGGSCLDLLLVCISISVSTEKLYFHIAGTIHYYDYITPLKPNSNYQSPQSSLTVDNMTNNASYNKVLHDNNIPNPTSSLRRPPLQPPNNPNDGAVREHGTIEPRPSTDDDEEWGESEINMCGFVPPLLCVECSVGVLER